MEIRYHVQYVAPLRKPIWRAIHVYSVIWKSKWTTWHQGTNSMACTRCATLKKTNLETYTCTKCHLKIDRDHMAARNIYIKYMYPYSIPPQGSESVSSHCNGDLPLAALWKFSIFSEIRTFNE
eukprot:NODE_6_length_48303_cov_0.387022.p22 type:complete len:123 gc:universal NODE_6_length_48303_cov_0.387022:31431-31063(-)